MNVSPGIYLYDIVKQYHFQDIQHVNCLVGLFCQNNRHHCEMPTFRPQCTLAECPVSRATSIAGFDAVKYYCTVWYNSIPLWLITPSMAGRPKIFDEKDVIRKASEIFWKKGYEASSAEELLEAMNMGKGSFYLHFKGGKKELYQRSLDLFSTEAMERFYKELSQEPDKIVFLKHFILSLSNAPNNRKQMGCYLGNGVVEMSNLDVRTKDQAGALLNKLEAAFVEIITEAQKAGKLKSQVTPTLMAKYLINLRNGINVTARTEKNAKTLKEMIVLSLEILN